MLSCHDNDLKEHVMFRKRVQIWHMYHFVVIRLYQIYWGHCDALLNAVPMEKIWLQLPKPNNEYNLQNTLSNRMRLYFNSIFNKADSTIKKKNNEIR